jgi:hypothetical protein
MNEGTFSNTLVEAVEVQSACAKHRLPAEGKPRLGATAEGCAANIPGPRLTAYRDDRLDTGHDGVGDVLVKAQDPLWRFRSLALTSRDAS